MITIAIVSYRDEKGRALLNRCLEAVEAHTDYSKNPYRVIIVSDRQGHVRAWNTALRAATPDDVIMLSDDIIIKDELWIDKLKTAAKEFGVGFSSIQCDVKDRGRIKYEWGLMGFCYINRECLDKVGYLDERFFCGFEEDDYAIRMKKAGLHPNKCQEVYHTHSFGTTLSRIWQGGLEVHFSDGMRKLREKWEL